MVEQVNPYVSSGMVCDVNPKAVSIYRDTVLPAER